MTLPAISQVVETKGELVLANDRTNLSKMGLGINWSIQARPDDRNQPSISIPVFTPFAKVGRPIGILAFAFYNSDGSNLSMCIVRFRQSGLPKPHSCSDSRFFDAAGDGFLVIPSFYRKVVNIRVLSVTSLNLSHALPVDLFRRHARSPKGRKLRVRKAFGPPIIFLPASPSSIALLCDCIERLNPGRDRIRDIVFLDTSAFPHRPQTTSRIPFRGWRVLDDHQREAQM
jgi:hypothetical protein